MKPSEFVRLIKKNGFALDHHGTRHDFYRNGDRLVMVERHTKDIKPKTLAKMMRDTGLK
ncbi:MAG: type II toxin-antitoxin system HicA family toxin [Oscillospiraceae bacterium]|nr:type II toxin-antitoxin system HicA family toxin [Oscillospiraceae bacterium]